MSARRAYSSADAMRLEDRQLHTSQSSPVLRNAGMGMLQMGGDSGGSSSSSSSSSSGSGSGSSSSSSSNSISDSSNSSSNSSSSSSKMDMDSLWDAFSSKTFDSGEWATKQKLLTNEDFEDCEAFLYLGLPAFTMLEIVIKSKAQAQAHGNGKFVLGNGIQLDESNCPDSWQPYYSAMCTGQETLQKVELTEGEMNFLRRQVGRWVNG